MIVTKNDKDEVLVIVGTVIYGIPKNGTLECATITDIKETSFHPDDETVYDYCEDMLQQGHDSYIIPHHYNGQIILDINW